MKGSRLEKRELELTLAGSMVVCWMLKFEDHERFNNMTRKNLSSLLVQPVVPASSRQVCSE